jgi:hypothetical protein
MGTEMPIESQMFYKKEGTESYSVKRNVSWNASQYHVISPKQIHRYKSSGIENLESYYLVTSVCLYVCKEHSSNHLREFDDILNHKSAWTS